jgi:transcription elongation factor Elf1
MMPSIHGDESRFPCARCGLATRSNELNASDGTGLDFCDHCAHSETIEELDQNNDYFTDHDPRGERALAHSDTLENSEFEW